jgi:hypothetical protein
MNSSSNSNAFYFMAWIGFIVASASYIIGILALEADIQTKGFFSICFTFAVYSAFTLAKVVRDRLEEARIVNR